MGLPSFSYCLCLKQQFLNQTLIYGKPLNARTMDSPPLPPFKERWSQNCLYCQFSVDFFIIIKTLKSWQNQ